VGSSTSRWWKRGLLTIAVVAVLAPIAVLIPHVTRSREVSPRLTHLVTRGDLLVSVTEQGTLESSENVEIKCKVRGANIPILWVIESGTEVKPGDELVRLETLEFEDRVNEVWKWVHTTRSAAERSKADLANAETAISAYLEGSYNTRLMTLKKDLAVAEASLGTAQNMLNHAEMMAERGYASALEVEEKKFAVIQADLDITARKTDIKVLEDFTKKMELETLNGNVKVKTARHEANKEREKNLAEQRVLCEADLANCVVTAERSGLVIHPTAEPWKYTPAIEVGATVYMGQTLLLMPDLSQMQVKVGIPEAIVHRIQPGLDARITLRGETLDGQVSSVASVTAPTSKWTGNIVTYDTIIKLPSGKGLMPGMSAEVEVIIARYNDVLTIPVAAVVGTTGTTYCWVKTSDGPQRRALELGDTNDVYTLVKGGVNEGDEVFLNPAAFEQTGTEVVEPLDKAEPDKPMSAGSRT
jgi:multidrug resistance efflux pump